MPKDFQRFTVVDAQQLFEQIDSLKLQLQAFEEEGDQLKLLETVSVLGSLLTTARQETEARKLLLNYQSLAETNNSSEQSGWFLLALATANQYLELRPAANEQFAEALHRAREHQWARLEHFVLHHWGRNLAEEGKLTEARACFVEALRLRELMNEPFQASTREALAALGKIEQK